MEIYEYILSLEKRAAAAVGDMSISSLERRNAVLLCLAEKLMAATDKILAANEKDLASELEGQNGTFYATVQAKGENGVVGGVSVKSDGILIEFDI